MVAITIPRKVITLWTLWDVRVAVLISFFLQTLLMFFAPLRKRKKDKWVSILVWVAYLLADWIAAYAIGLICNSKFFSSSSNKNENLPVFWAPFLLLHLGGPDTITAFSIEDNELWLRHLLGLFFQFSVTAYTLLQSLSNNPFLLPTFLMFIVGLAKYGERTRALYLACLDNFKDTVSQQPQSFLDTSEGKEWLARVSSSDNKEMMIIEIMQSAYLWFRTFKGVIVDHVFNLIERAKSRDFFVKRNTKQVFKILEIELSFLYDILYTKAYVVHSLVGYIFRIFCTCSILISFFLFFLLDKDEIHNTDIHITYTLIIGAISLDAIALLMVFSSDWTIVTLQNSKAKCIASTILTYVPILNGPRWSDSLPQYNMINHILNEHPHCYDKMINYMRLNNFLVAIQFKTHEPLTDEFKSFIVTELRKKYEGTEFQQQQIEEILSTRGDVVLKKNGWNNVEYSIADVEFDVSLLLWHIATEICYCMSEDPNDIDDHEKEKTCIDDKQDFRQFSKLLSDYMLYLLIMQPVLMAPVAGFGQIKYRKTYEHAKGYFFHDGYWKISPYTASCEFFETARSFESCDIEALKMESFLTDGSVLARKIYRYENKWEIISKLWVEMLCYAASRCKKRSHIEQLSKGGELITFIWLLMAHLGLGKFFR